MVYTGLYHLFFGEIGDGLLFCQHWIKIQKRVVYELRSARAILRSWASIEIWHIRWFVVKMPTSASLAVSASLVSSTWDVLNVCAKV